MDCGETGESINRSISNDISSCEKYLSKIFRMSKAQTECNRRCSQSLEREKVCPFMTVPMRKTLNTPRPAITKHMLSPPLAERSAARPSKTTTQSVSMRPGSNKPAKDKQMQILSPLRRPRSCCSASPGPDRTARSDKNTWATTLQRRPVSDEVTKNPFDQFDPLRTLHFLAKELNSKVSKVKTASKDDTDIHKVVRDMQEVLQRIPSEMLQSDETDEYEKDKHYYNKENFPFPVCSAMKPIIKLDHKSSQTNFRPEKEIVNGVEVAYLQLQMEEGMAKLEATCRNLELSCTRLRAERDELRSKLCSEQQSAEVLKQQLANKEKDLTDIRISMENKIDDLHKEIDKISFDTQVKRKLQVHNELLQKEVETAHREATIAKMNYEKLYVLIETRDKQLDKLHKEFASVQMLVNEQLLEIKSKKHHPICSSPSSRSELATPSWLGLSNIGSQILLENDVVEYSCSTRGGDQKGSPQGDDSQMYNESDLSFMELPSEYSMTHFATDVTPVKDAQSVVASRIPPREHGDGLITSVLITQPSDGGNIASCKQKDGHKGKSQINHARESIHKLFKEVRHSFLNTSTGTADHSPELSK